MMVGSQGQGKAAGAPTLHAGGPLLRAGASLEQARRAMIMVHGRGASAESILGLAAEFDASDVAYLAPRARGNTWYPLSFLAPVAANEPWLSSAIARIGEVVDEALAAGIDARSIYLLGFSQGACLAAEYAARHPRRYGGVIVLSGGLIGTAQGLHAYRGSLAGTPVFLGCSTTDAHIPRERVVESGEVFRGLGAEVTVWLYEGMGHTVNQDEIDWVNALLAARHGLA